MDYRISVPVTREELATLRAGDRVLLSGRVYTARDAAHQRLTELLDRGEALPIPLAGEAIYYVGPTPEPPGRPIGAAGPTTAGRMDRFTPRLLELGLSLMIGKGERSEEVVRAMVRNGAVYLAALGGAGALMSACVRSVKMICWEDLGCEALRELTVEDMPLIVAVDSLGGSIYQDGPAAYRKSLER